MGPLYETRQGEVQPQARQEAEDNDISDQPVISIERQMILFSGLMCIMSRHPIDRIIPERIGAMTRGSSNKMVPSTKRRGGMMINPFNCLNIENMH